MFDRHPGSPDPYAEARDKMIDEQLRCRGVVMHSVLEAMRAVPRHLFISHELSSRAYADEALPSLDGQTISQPYMVAIMTQELALQPGHCVLELGTGTGYQTAILAHLVRPGGQVFTIERVPTLHDFAKRRLEALGYQNIQYFVGDGSQGWPSTAPDQLAGPALTRPRFDRILVTAGSREIPPPLLPQLAEGGILLIPLGNAESQMLTLIVRCGSHFQQSTLLSCRFVPLIGEHAWPPENPAS